MKTHQVVEIVETFATTPYGSDRGTMPCLPAMPELNEYGLRAIMAACEYGQLHFAVTDILPVQRIVEVASEYNLKMLTHTDMYAASLALADCPKIVSYHFLQLSTPTTAPQPKMGAFGQPCAQLPTAGQWSLYICQDKTSHGSVSAAKSFLRYAFVSLMMTGSSTPATPTNFFTPNTRTPWRPANAFLSSLRQCHGPGEAVTGDCDLAEAAEAVSAAEQYNELVHEFDAMVLRVFKGHGRRRH
ncbi:hypothetical protein TI39_contig456g00001 [Zymoseptoria brevis]|uniref:Uncharacterized protein n=1 Tax=Zymoseptoria brevis TaxID=1047168 RepID=A0A0F4GKR6_9PEZI|nr:hypothetical protein TI39_contig456g00001 [Zymoseptoria brevis]